MGTGTFRNMSIAIDSLETYRDILTQSNSDGISRQTTAILNVGLSNCYKALGLENLSTGLESYTTCTSRDGLLKVEVSLESIMDKIKVGVKKVWEWILKMLESVKKQYEKIGNVALKLKNDIKGIFKKSKDTKKSADTEESEETKELSEDEYRIFNFTARKLTAFIKNDQLIPTSKTKVYEVVMGLCKKLPEIADKHYDYLEELTYKSRNGEAFENTTNSEERISQNNKTLNFANFEMPDFCKFNFNGYAADEYNYDIEFEPLIPKESESVFHKQDFVILKARSIREAEKDLEELKDWVKAIHVLSEEIKFIANRLEKMVSRVTGKNDKPTIELANIIWEELSLFKSNKISYFLTFCLWHTKAKMEAVREEIDAAIDRERGKSRNK